MSENSATTGGDDTWYLPITSCTRVEGAQARMAMRKFLSVLTRLWEPCDLAFVVSMVPDGELSMGWQVKTDSGARSERFLNDLRTAGRQVAPWLGIGEPTSVAPWPQPGPALFGLERAATDTGDLVPIQSLVWPAVKGLAGTGPFTTVLSFDVLPDALDRSDVTTSWAADEESAQGDGDGTADSDLLLRYTIHGTSSDMRLVAALVAEDTAGDVGLRETPIAPGAQAPCLPLPAEAVAHLLAVPAQVRGLLPDAIRPAEDLFDLMESGASPHVLVQGQTGGGKSTLLEHMIARSIHQDRAVFVIDVHDGAVVRQAERLLRERGRDPLVVTFGQRDAQGELPVMSFTKCPDGLDPRQFAHDQTELLVGNLHDGGRLLREQHAAVGQRGLLTQMQILCLDPSPTPLTIKDVPRLLDPAEKILRREVLTRIGDWDLARSWMKEVMPTVESRDPDNAAIWWLGKSQPLLATPHIRAIACGEGREVALEQAFREGRSVLVNVPSGVLGEAGARILAAQLVDRFWLWAGRTLHQIAFDLYADEWQKHPSSTFAQLLAESRKIGIRLFLSNQSTEQLRPSLRDAALANIGSLVTFSTSRRDAEMIGGLYPSITVGGLQRLPKHHVAVTNRSRDFVALTPAPMPRVSAPINRVGGLSGPEGASEVPTLDPPLSHDDPRWDKLFGPQTRHSGPDFGEPAPASFLDQWLEKRKKASAHGASSEPRVRDTVSFARAAGGRTTQDRIVVGNDIVEDQGVSAGPADARVVAVVDGMGGRPAGALAAEVVARNLSNAVAASDASGTHWSLRARQQLRQTEIDDPASKGLGARAAVLWAHPEALEVERVGDVICLWLDDGGVQDLDDIDIDGTGLRALESNTTAPLRLDRCTLPAHSTRLLLASDGLLEVRTRDELANLLNTSTTAMEVVKRIEAEAPLAPQDDISVICVDLVPAGGGVEKTEAEDGS